MRDTDRLLDSLLVVRAQDGDEDAFRQLFQRYHNRLEAYAARYLNDAYAAPDAVQEAWLNIARRLRALRDPAQFRSWAFRIVTNKCIDRSRRKTKERELVEVLKFETESAENDSALVSENKLSVANLVRDLPPDRRALMTLFYVEGLTIGELASVFGIAEGTAKTRLYHTREALRRKMEAKELGDGS